MKHTSKHGIPVQIKRAAIAIVVLAVIRAVASGNWVIGRLDTDILSGFDGFGGGGNVVAGCGGGSGGGSEEESGRKGGDGGGVHFDGLIGDWKLVGLDLERCL